MELQETIAYDSLIFVTTTERFKILIDTENKAYYSMT